MEEEQRTDDPETEEVDVIPLGVHDLRTEHIENDPIDKDIQEDPDYEHENDNESTSTSEHENVNNSIADAENACTVVTEEASHRRSRRK